MYACAGPNLHSGGPYLINTTPLFRPIINRCKIFLNTKYMYLNTKTTSKSTIISILLLYKLDQFKVIMTASTHECNEKNKDRDNTC